MHSSAGHHTSDTGAATAVATKGLILNRGWRYDLELALADIFMFRGQLRALRQRVAALARLQPGQHVLDVGCGTGTLALEVQRCVGTTGCVVGIDPGPRQIARARQKALRHRVAIDFQLGTLEQLVFPERTFDVVLSTLMLHHLPQRVRQQGLAEVARVLKPGGRVVLADFTSSSQRRGRAARFHAGGLRLQDVVALVTDAGFVHIATEELQPARFSAFPGAGLVCAVKA